jgi:hypothetical protein
MYPVDFEKRLKRVERSGLVKVNCISVAFYLLGLRSREKHIDPFKSPLKVIQSFEVVGQTANEPSHVPAEAVAVGIWSERAFVYCHLGIISPLNRAEIIDRPGSGEPIRRISYDALYDEYFPNRTSVPKFHFLRVNPKLYLK